MARLAVFAVVGFLWERERIRDEEVLRCLRESEDRRGVPLTQSLNIISTVSKKRSCDQQEIHKRRNHVIRATPVVTKLPVSWNSVLVRQQRARQQQNTSPVSTSHNTPLHDSPSSSHNSTQYTPQSPVTETSKLKDNNVQDKVSWWSDLVGYTIGYTLGVMNNFYNDVIHYVMPNNNSNKDDNEDVCDPNNILTTDALLLAKKCLNRGKNDETVKLSPLLNELSLHSVKVTNVIINKVVEMMKCYTDSPVPISLFEDALIAADYDGTTRLPVGTLQWSPQQYSTTNIQSEKIIDDNLHDWKLVHHVNDTSLYIRPYKDTQLSQYRVVSRFSDITALDFVEVQANPSLRQQWDSYSGKMKVVDKDDVSNSEVLYWEVKFPFPLSNRDYVFTRRCVILPHSIITLSRATQHPSVPPSQGCVRVDTFNSVMVVTADTSVDKDGFCFELIYVDDPKCNLPSSLSNWASTSGMMDYLTKVHSVALKRKGKHSK